MRAHDKKFSVKCPVCAIERQLSYKDYWGLKHGRRTARCYRCSRFKKGQTNTGGFKKGERPWNYGRLTSKDYNTIHGWLRREHGSARICENENCKGASKSFDWAKKPNVPYGYERDNYMQLCRVCHFSMDYSFIAKKVEVVCEWCGNRFKYSEKQQLRKPRKFCSTTCSLKNMHKLNTKSPWKK